MERRSEHKAGRRGVHGAGDAVMPILNAFAAGFCCGGMFISIVSGQAAWAAIQAVIFVVNLGIARDSTR